MLRHWINTGWRQWRAEPWRAAAAVLVFSAVVSLMLVFEGLRFGILKDLRAFPAALPADFVIVERGHGQFAMTPSKLPQFARQQAEAVDGVVTAEPLALAPVIITWNDLKTPSMVLAYDHLEFPAQLRSGRRALAAREVVIDSALAARHQVTLGQTITIFDYALTVVGVSDGTTSPFAPYIFLHYDDLIDLFLETDMAIGDADFSLLSVLLVRAESGADPLRLRAALTAAVPDGEVHTPAELGTRDARFGWRLLGPVLILTSSTAWLIGILVMGFLRFAEVQAHLAEFGVQKALGANSLFLAVVLTVGGLALIAFAFPLGLLGAAGLAALIHAWNPLYSVVLAQPAVLGGALAATLAAALLGSLIPMWTLRRLEPSLVFQR